MRIIALDIATCTGIAVGGPNETPRAWSIDLGEAPNGRRFSQALRMTQGLIQKYNPDLIVAEAAIGGPKASAYLIGLVSCVEGVCWNRGVNFRTAHIGTVRRHFIGKALTTRDFPHLKPAAAKKAIKAEVIKRCELMGWEVEDADSADALAVLDWACATQVKGFQAAPLGGLFA